MDKLDLSDVVILGSTRDFHAMDWYRTLKKIHKNKVYFLTDSLSAEGMQNLSNNNDNIHHLFIIDEYLGTSQTNLFNVWRNILKIIFLPIQVLKLRKFKKKHPNVIFHSHPIYYLFICWIARVKCGVTPQGSEILVRPFSSIIYKYFLIRLLRYASFVTVDSFLLKKKISNLAGVKAIVFQNGIDTNSILKMFYNVKSERSSILSIRGMTQLYNIDKILYSRNFSNLSKGIDFIYPFSDEAYFNKTCSLLSSSDKLYGMITKPKLYKFLQKSLLVISVPSSDSSPRSVYEAIFSGCFVAATSLDYIHSLPDCMKSRIFLVDLDDPNWLNNAYSWALTNKYNLFSPTKDALYKYDQFSSMYSMASKIYLNS